MINFPLQCDPSAFVPPETLTVADGDTRYTVATLEISRNRYSNILPSNLHRVNRNNQAGYYNASWISDQHIAAQGPIKPTLFSTKADTINDFWLTIWANQVGVIQRVCDCDDLECPSSFDTTPRVIPCPPADETITLIPGVPVTETLSPKHQLTTTKIQIKHSSGKVLEVVHRHFIGWEDMEGAEAAALGTFLAKYNPLKTTLTHCKAGVGRTGVVIAILLAVEQDNFDILALIAKLRERRVSMVQSKPQFTLIYDTLNWLWANHHLSSPPPAISSSNNQ